MYCTVWGAFQTVKCSFILGRNSTWACGVTLSLCWLIHVDSTFLNLSFLKSVFTGDSVCSLCSFFETFAIRAMFVNWNFIWTYHLIPKTIPCALEKRNTVLKLSVMLIWYRILCSVSLFILNLNFYPLLTVVFWSLQLKFLLILSVLLYVFT